jgi:FHS family L-fucose permease-like MFS transporter
MAQFGPSATSEQRLNFAQSLNPPGTILGVIIGARFIFSGVELKPTDIAAMKTTGTYSAYLHTELNRVVPPYLVLGFVVLTFAAVLSRIKFPTLNGEHQHNSIKPLDSFLHLSEHPHLWFAVIANFCNVGAQVSSWSSLIPYLKQYTSVSERTAAGYLTGTLVALMLGRFVTTPLMKRVQPSLLLGLYGVANVALMGIAITNAGMTGAYAIVVSSFFLSIMFPTIFALGLKGLGPHTKLAGSLLVMAIVGGAVFPPILGYIAKLTGSIAKGYIVPAFGFLGVAVYGFLAPRISPDSVHTSTETTLIIEEYDHTR